MVKRRRDRHDITIQILNRAKNGKSKTELMREANISHAQAKQFLGMLGQHGLLELDENRRYKTTKKGLEFLEKCESCFLFEWSKQER
jgi:predicted transcriptional regulator